MSDYVETRTRLILQYSSLLDLNPISYRVLLYIIGDLSFIIFSLITQKHLCDELNINSKQVSLAIKELVSKNILETNPNSIFKVNKKELKLKYYDIDELDSLIREKIQNNLSRSQNKKRG